MAGYWTKVHRRTLALALKASGLETRDRAIMVVVVQAMIAAGVFFALEDAEISSRVIAALVPFLLIPAWYLIKLPGVPPALELEDQAKIALLEVAAAGQSDKIAHALLVTASYATGGLGQNGPVSFDVDIEHTRDHPIALSKIQIVALNGEEVVLNRFWNETIIHPRSMTTCQPSLVQRAWAEGDQIALTVAFEFGLPDEPPTRRLQRYFVGKFAGGNLQFSGTRPDETSIPRA